MGVTCGQFHLCLTVTIIAFSAVYSLTCSLDAQIYLIEMSEYYFYFVLLTTLLCLQFFAHCIEKCSIIDICYISITILKETLSSCSTFSSALSALVVGMLLKTSVIFI